MKQNILSKQLTFVSILQSKNLTLLCHLASTMSRKCLNDPNSICYICAEFTSKAQRRPLSETIRTYYKWYFGFSINDEGKSWVPHICCVTCACNLTQWIRGDRESMPFRYPAMWREPTNHNNDCYFCSATDQRHQCSF
jgi:hypothetical protein